MYLQNSKTGELVDPAQAIFPILQTDLYGHRRVVGTGFCIAREGIFVTAGHVADLARPSGPSRRTPAHEAVMFQPDNTFLLRPVRSYSIANQADVAVGAMKGMTHRVTGAPLLNIPLVLSSATPPMGSDIETWPYARTLQVDRAEMRAVELHFNPDSYFGTLEEYHLRGRDRVMMPFPCYRGTIELLAGASGGPVIHDSAVIAVNRTSFEGHERVSYYTDIRAIGACTITDVTMNGEHRDEVTISELIQHGAIKVNP